MRELYTFIVDECPIYQENLNEEEAYSRAMDYADHLDDMEVIRYNYKIDTEKHTIEFTTS